MPDESVDDIIEENHDRKAEHEAQEAGEGGFFGDFEKTINPIIEVFEHPRGEDPDEEDMATRRELNDEAQQPD